MTIETITGQWNETNLERINRNFATLSARDYEIMQDFLSADPAVLTPTLNGLMKPSESEFDLRSLHENGINFKADVNGVLYKGSVYCAGQGSIGFGLAEQSRNGEATAELYYNVFDVKRGWNEIELLFPIEQGKEYTLFKRSAGNTVLTNSTKLDDWSSTEFMENGITIQRGKNLGNTGGILNYTPFYEIKLITSLAQVYKIANDSVKPPQQFYVGDNPPQDASFWFKPVGGED